MLQASLEQALARRQKYITPGGALTHVSTYLGTNKMELLAQGKTAQQAADAMAGQPMAYLVEQAPEAVVAPHFHEVDQFQLFVGGAGRIGTHDLSGMVVHYAGAFSPYGPIAAGPQGVDYVTLRRDWDKGAQWMPGAAQVLRELRGRRHRAHTSAPLDLTAGDLTAGLLVTEIMNEQTHGASARLCRAAGGLAMQADPAGTAGMFWYLLAGSVSAAQGAEQGPRACLYFPSAQGSCPVQIGSAGAQFLELRFPVRQDSAPLA